MNAEMIFAEALKHESPAARTQYLADTCGEDRALRAEVESLLAAHNDAGSFLEKSPEELIENATTDPARLTADSAARSADDEWQNVLEVSDRVDCLGRLGPYDVIELVGRGGMGVVVRASDPKLNRIVAIKLLAPELAAQATSVQRFLREARAAAAVSHDHVVSIYAIDDDARPPMIAMEMVDGQSLQQKIDSTGALDVKSILRIGMQTAAGLSAAHRQGLVHRDIKPANILLENGIEKVKLTDFGLARAVDDIGMTKTGQITGTPQYMSPEQAQGERVDHRTDLFSLGCVLYAMCTGLAAFRADSAVAVMHRVVHDTPRPIWELNEDIPDWLCEIVDKLLEKNPDARFDSAEEVEELLGRHLAHLQQPDSVPQPERIATPGFARKDRGVRDAFTTRDSLAGREHATSPTETRRRATTAFTIIGVLDLLMMPAWGMFGSTTLSGTGPLAMIVGVSCVMLSPACGAYLLLVTLIGRRFQPAPRTLDRNTGLAASVVAMLPIGPVHVLALPVSLWARSVFLRRRIDESPPYRTSDLSGKTQEKGDRAPNSRRWLRIGAIIAFTIVVGFVCLELYGLTNLTQRAMYWIDDEGELVLSGVEPGTEIIDESRTFTWRNYPRAFIAKERPSLRLKQGWYGITMTFPDTISPRRHTQIHVRPGEYIDYPINKPCASIHIARLKFDAFREHETGARCRVVVNLPDDDTEFECIAGGEFREDDSRKAFAFLSPGKYELQAFGIVNRRLATIPIEFHRTGDDREITVPNDTLRVVVINSTVGEEQARSFAQLAATWADRSEQESIVCLDVARDGKYLVSGHAPDSNDLRNHVRLWDVEEASLVQGGSTHTGTELPAGVKVTDVAFSTSGRFFAWTQDDGKLRRLPTDSASQLPETDTFRAVEGPLFCLAWSPDDTRVVTGGKGKLYFWETTDKGDRRKLKASLAMTVDAHDGKDVRTVAWSPDGRWITTGSSDGKVYWWDSTAESPVGEIRNDSGKRAGDDQSAGITSMQWSPDSRKVAFSQTNGDVRVQHADGQHSLRINGEGHPSLAVAWSPDSLCIASSQSVPEDDAHIRVETDRSLPADKRPSRTFEHFLRAGRKWLATDLVFTRDGRYLISGSKDGTIQWWEFSKPLAPVTAKGSKLDADSTEPGFVENPAARELFRRFERTLQEKPSVRLQFVGNVTETTGDGKESLRYWGAYAAKPGAKKSRWVRYADGHEGGYWTTTGIKFSRINEFYDAPPYDFFINQISRSGFTSNGLKRFIKGDGPLTWEMYQLQFWPLGNFRFADDDKSFDPQPNATARTHETNSDADSPPLTRIPGSRILAYTVRPSEDTAFDVRLWIDEDTLAPRRREVRFSASGQHGSYQSNVADNEGSEDEVKQASPGPNDKVRSFHIVETYRAYSTDEISEPFVENAGLKDLAELLVESGSLSRLQADGAWEPTEWIVDGHTYRADQATHVLFEDKGPVFFDGGTEVTFGRGRLRLRAGRLSTQTTHRSSVSLVYRATGAPEPPTIIIDDDDRSDGTSRDQSHDVIVFDATSTGGQAIFTATPDRILVERGSMTVQHPRQGNKRTPHLYLREGVEYLFNGETFIPQKNRSLPPVPFQSNERIVWQLDLSNDAQVQEILKTGKLIKHEGRPVLSSHLGTVQKRGPGTARMIALDLSKLSGIPHDTRLALRYRYFTEQNEYVTGDEIPDIIFPQTNHWTTFTTAGMKTSDLMKTIRWRHERDEPPLLIDRVELIAVNDADLMMER